MKELKLSKIMLCVMGITMFILGFLTLSLPSLTLTTLALMLGCGFVVSGIFCLFSFFSEKEILLNPGWVLTEGILDISIGFFLLWNLGTTIVAIPYIIAFWILFGSIAKFSASFVLRKTGVDKWWILLFNGVIGIFIACMMIFFPFFGTSFTVLLIGMYLIIYGILVFAEAATGKVQELKNLAK